MCWARECAFAPVCACLLIGRCRKQQRELQESWEKGHTALQDKHAEVVTMLKEQQQSLDKLTLDKTQLASEYSALEQKHAELERAQKAREGRYSARSASKRWSSSSQMRTRHSSSCMRNSTRLASALLKISVRSASVLRRRLASVTARPRRSFGSYKRSSKTCGLANEAVRLG